MLAAVLVAGVRPGGAVVDQATRAATQLPAAPKLRVQALDCLGVQLGQRNVAEHRLDGAPDVAGVLVCGLDFDVEPSQPSVQGFTERRPGLRGAPGVLLGEEAGQQFLCFAPARRGAREVDPLAGQRAVPT